MPSRTATRLRSRWNLGGVVLTLVVASVAFVGCSGDPVPPAELQGTWSTTYPDYADRAFAISDSSVTFFQGEGRSSVHRLVGLERKDLPGRVSYTLRYELDGATAGFSFEYIEPGLIKLKNQEHMDWKRQS